MHETSPEDSVNGCFVVAVKVKWLPMSLLVDNYPLAKFHPSGPTSLRLSGRQQTYNRLSEKKSTRNLKISYDNSVSLDCPHPLHPITTDPLQDTNVPSTLPFLSANSNSLYPALSTHLSLKTPTLENLTPEPPPPPPPPPPTPPHLLPASPTTCPRHRCFCTRDEGLPAARSSVKLDKMIVGLISRDSRTQRSYHNRYFPVVVRNELNVHVETSQDRGH